MGRTISLRAFITIPFLGLFLAAGAAISAISYHNAQDATERLARQLVSEVGARIEAHLQHFFSAPATMLQLNLEAMRGGRLDAAAPDRLMARFSDQIRSVPYLTFASYADAATGQYVAASRPPEAGAAAQLMTALAGDALQLRTWEIGADGMPALERPPGNRYDARQRPYFKLAEERDGVFWYPVYRYHAFDSLGVGLAARLRDDQGRLLGVFAADVALVQIARYLQSLQVGEAGVAFVAERNGELLASSTAGPVFSLHGDQFSRVSVIGHPDPLLRAAGELLRAAGGDADGQHVIESGGERHLLDLRRFTDVHGLDLLIGVLLPEHEFTAVVEHGARQALLLTLVAIALGAAIGLILTRWIANPVERISVHAARLALGELEAHGATRTPIREIHELSASFDKMAADLRDMIDRLESRVAERTRELQEVNRELERLSSLDGLTRIANRRCFDDTLQREWERARRNGKPLALLLGDVDQFKAFNDQYGHQQGDHALQAVARCLAGCARRPADVAARYGGEEFAMILPDTDIAGACLVGQSVRRSVREAHLSRDDAPLADRVTISVGAASMVPVAGSSPSDLVEAADRALYRAKERGRDRVVSASDDS